MLTIIFGKPGAGKSSLNTYFLKEQYFTEGVLLQNLSRAKIAEHNKARSVALTCPTKPPIFSDYRVSFQIGYEEYYEPYFVNGYYMGLTNESMPTQYLPPGSKVFLSEAQRYYDSRKKQFPSWVSRFFEMHRHNELDVTMDVQRAMLIDKNIRDNCSRYIEVMGIDHVYDGVGNIRSSSFNCREFYNRGDLEQYLDGGAATYKEVVYLDEGDIFDSYDSYSYAKEFLPPEGKDFTYLEFLSPQEIAALPSDIRRFYDLNEPAGYRTEGKEKKEVKEKKV